MAANAPPKTTQETWKDWIGPDEPEPDELLTRDEVIEAVERVHRLERFANKRHGKEIIQGTQPVSEDDLKYWESIGVLPRPVQFRADGLERELYPAWYITLVDHVRLLQDYGHSLEEIRERIRNLVERMQGQFLGHETWRDWMPSDAPEPELLSRNELLQALRDRGVNITAYTLEHYRRNGILPRPVRLRHGGVTQAVYPSWFISAIEHLKQLQAAGKSLDEIKPWMRSWAFSTVQWRDPLAEPLAAVRAALQALAAAVEDSEITGFRVSLIDDTGAERFAHEGRLPSDTVS